MLNGRNMKSSKKFSNKNIMKVSKCGICGIYGFWAIKIFRATGKMTHPQAKGG